MIERHGSTHVKITGQDAVNYKNENQSIGFFNQLRMFFGKSVVISADNAFSYFESKHNRYGMEFCEGLCKRDIKLSNDSKPLVVPLSGDVTFGKVNEVDENQDSAMPQSGDIAYGKEPSTVKDEKPYRLGPDDMY
ncbi:hypothetical protein [Endozoicomonas elysicola]|uniref:Uncharacterized protein n=1 Tax=Endozoicomonas elysicola TaxID=305900 RepID=A0A081KCD6_9GAMM|nr:hypothetical protein [Endozoicomonas elysicola]KEI71812.1 hypothetical protein GV64_14655 [Endozoicomonas elysicola]